MRIFLTGATGYIGSALARRLDADGHEVVALTRDAGKSARLREHGATPVVGDFKSPASWRKEADACEALIHLGFESGPNAEAADRNAVAALLRSAKSARAPRYFIYTSGVWVLGPAEDAPVTEASSLAPPEIVRWRPSVEQAVLSAHDHGLSVAVVRPGCVYGGNGGLYGMMLQALITERKLKLVGGGKNSWASVYLDDLVDLYRLILEQRPNREIFHATDGSAEPIRKAAEAFAQAAGGADISDWPLAQARKQLGPLADALALDQRVSSEKARIELGWQPAMRSPAKHAASLLEQWQAQAQAQLSGVA